MNKCRCLIIGAISLTPLLLINYGLDRHVGEGKVNILLASLLIALCLDMFFMASIEKRFQEKSPAPILRWSRHRFLATLIKSFIIGVLLLVVAALNIYVLIIFLALIPLEIISYRLLHRELEKRSRLVLQQSGEDYKSSGHTYLSKLVWLFNRVESIGFMLPIRILARTVLVVLAVYLFILTRHNPLPWVLYCILLPLFCSTVSQVFNGRLSHWDLLNSIYYLERLEVEDIHGFQDWLAKNRKSQ